MLPQSTTTVKFAKHNDSTQIIQNTMNENGKYFETNTKNRKLSSFFCIFQLTKMCYSIANN